MKNPAADKEIDMTPELRERGALKPCPFCGGEAVLWNGADNSWSVECYDGNGGCMVTTYRPTEAEAIAAWNRRAVPATPDIAALLATAGEWQVTADDCHFGTASDIFASGSIVAQTVSGYPMLEHNAAAIVASVNFVRDELPALIARHEAEIAAAYERGQRGGLDYVRGKLQDSVNSPPRGSAK